jgi:hypothetical protein
LILCFRDEGVCSYTLLLIIVLISSSSISSVTCNIRIICAQSDVEGAIKQAEADVLSAFVSVLDAQEAGANVTRLIIKLNESGTLLSEAEGLFKKSQFNEVIDRCALSMEISEAVQIEAEEVKASASSYRDRFLSTTMMYSLIGSILFLISMFVLWRRFKAYHLNK